MTPDRPPAPLHPRFGPFELRVAERQLLLDGTPAKLGGRAFDLLVALVERRDRVVHKNELLDIVWPHVVVEENNLQVHIWALRKLLGASALSTVPGRGYRFTALLDEPPATAVEAPAPAAAAAPSPPLEAPPRNTLPAPRGGLIGRDDDLLALSALLDRHALVSIVGAGGVGKTRLAQHLLHNLHGAGVDGVFWVDLAGLSDATLVAGTVAAAVGVPNGGADPLVGLVAALRPLQALIALDNAEHLIEAVAAVARALIDGAPGVRLLVTSQASLRLAGEQVYRLGPLPVPPATLGLEEAAGYGAVALFAERARAADRRFALEVGNLAAVVEICARLDGMALAIELAAARVPLLGVTRLAAALDERFRVLGAGRRDAPQRQQALHAALDWSHALLAAAEQATFRRLGVFAGSFSLEMAQVVASDEDGDEGLDAWAVVDVLGTLVDRSLVSVELRRDDAAAPPRYRLLETPRAFALERLAAAGEQAVRQQRHAVAVLAHFEAIQAARRAGRVGTDAAIARLQPDLDNGREVLAWALEHDAGMALALAPPLGFALRERRQEERAVWEATAAKFSDEVPAAVRACWAQGCAHFWAARRPAPSAQWARIAIALYRTLDDRIGLYLALAELSMSDPAQMSEEQRAALDEMTALDDPSWPAMVRCRGAMAELRACSTAGDFGAAEAAAQRMLLLAEGSGDSVQVNGTLANLADLALSLGHVDEAVSHGVALERRLRGTHQQMNLAFARVNLAGALLAQGSLQQARQTALAGWPQAAVFDLREYWVDYLSLLAALEGRPSCSARLRGLADALYAAIGSTRQGNETRAVERAEQLARAALGDLEFERLRIDGSRLQDHAVAEVAFGAADDV